MASAIEHAIWFISFCHHKRYSPESVTTYISAWSYTHKLNHHANPTDCFVTKKMLESYRHLDRRHNFRALITMDILHKLNETLSHIWFNKFKVLLFRVEFSLAYFDLPRVGELAFTDSKQASHAMGLNDVCPLVPGSHIATGICKSKGNQSGSHIFIKLSAQSDKSICHVHLLNTLFVRKDTSPRHFLTQYKLETPYLKSILWSLG